LQPKMTLQNLVMSAPCSSLVKKSASIRVVGQCLILMSLAFVQSLIQK